VIQHAWERIEEPVEHAFAKRKLRGSHNLNARVDENVLRLMGAVAEIRVEAEGEASVLRVQLLGSNVEQYRRDGMRCYRFPDELRRVIKESRVFARLQTDVMFALTSKYGLTLYAMVHTSGTWTSRWMGSGRSWRCLPGSSRLSRTSTAGLSSRRSPRSTPYPSWASRR
jgi:hypothetical protein